MCVEKNDNEDKKFVDFYGMVKKWTEYDYKMPGLKSEVIIDMLITDFIKEIVEVGLFEVGLDEKVKFVTKEFPILSLNTRNKNNGLCARVDYLLKSESGNDVYLVELKTDPNSFEVDQLANMIKTAEEWKKDKLSSYGATITKKSDELDIIYNELCKPINNVTIVYICLNGLSDRTRTVVSGNTNKKASLSIDSLKYITNTEPSEYRLTDYKIVDEQELKSLYVKVKNNGEHVEYRIPVIDISKIAARKRIAEKLPSEKKQAWRAVCKIIEGLK